MNHLRYFSYTLARFISPYVVMLVLTCCVMKAGYSQQLQTHLSQENIVLGDQVEWSWTLTMPQQWAIAEYPHIGDSIGAIHVINSTNIDSLSTDTEKTYTQKIILSGYDSLEVEMPVLTAKVYHLSTHDTLEITSLDKHHLSVALFQLDANDTFRTIKEIEQIDNPDFWSRMGEHITEYKFIYITAIVLLILAVILYVIYKMYKKRKNAKIIEPPYQKAMRRIHELEHSRLWENEEYKKYYTELSLIIKNYIKESTDIDTDQLTSSELLREFKKNKSLKPLHKPLRDLLFTADITKFAKGEPHQEYRQEAISHSELIVRTIEQYKTQQSIHVK